MAKFHGKIGYGGTYEKRPGVCEVGITEREYYGDLTRNMNRFENSGQVNDDLNLSNTISIIADAFAYQNFQSMRYVELMGAKWKIKSIDIQRPRMILTIGGVWNDEDGEED